MKTATTRIRLTEQERRELDSLAKRMHLSRSELIRRFIHAGIHQNETAHIVKWDNNTIRVIRDYNMLISKIGTNVNQIARACNTGNTNHTLANEIRIMQQILENMKKAVEKCL